METRHTIEISRPRTSVRVLPQLSRSAGFWAVALSFFVVTAFSTAPSSLYGLYEQREHLSLLTITFVYAVYAVGVVVILVLAGHVSDWYGRRAVLLPAIAVTIAAGTLFLLWMSVTGLFIARILRASASARRSPRRPRSSPIWMRAAPAHRPGALGS